MPTHKRSLRLLSQSELAEVLRVDARTVRAKLAESGVEPAKTDGRTKFYDSGRAIRAVLLGAALDLTAERAREHHERANKLALENAERRGRLIPADSAAWWVGNCNKAVRDAIRGVPAWAQRELGVSRELGERLLDRIDDALRGLAQRPLPPGFDRRVAHDFEAALATGDATGNGAGTDDEGGDA